MNKILVTGHRGWIGSNFTKLLDNLDIEYVGMDRVDGLDLLKNIELFRKKLEHCNTVVHLAATPRIPNSWKLADDYRDNNVGVTDQVARICAEQNKYLVFASSSSVYGDGQGPLNPYSWTKLAGEESIRMYGRSRNLQYTIARIFTNYSDNDPSGLVIGKWLQQYRAKEAITIRGTGEQTRDFIHVSDTCKALLAICQQKPAARTLDIGTGRAYKLKEIAEVLEARQVYEPELTGYALNTLANTAATQEFLSWSADIDLLEWIRSRVLQ